MLRSLPFALLLLTPAALVTAQVGAPLGLFDEARDVGAVLHPGVTHFDAAAATYTITGSGENMWFAKDDFQFVYKKMSGDLSLAADIRFLGKQGNHHRKAVLMVRQSLDTGSPAVDIALHGDGLTSLQFRDAANGDTHEIESAATAPKRVRLVKRGDRLYAYVSGPGGTLEPAGASIRVPFTGEFYVGLGVSAHDKNASETAVFSNVALTPLPPEPASSPAQLWSVLETVNVASTDRRVAYLAPEHFEAPNWSRDGSFLIVNRSQPRPNDRDGSRILRLSWNQAILAAGPPTVINTGAQKNANNDHGLSPDGTQLAISDNSAPDRASRVYVLPVTGGEPRQITPTGPSYWHGWSPDGQTLAFTGQRAGEFDIYTVPLAGGAETRLTTAKGLDDGPEYAPDGRRIFFCSVRSGHMQLWRMRPDGSAQEQLLTSNTDDWFPHVSPDGKLVAFVSFPLNTDGHPPNKEVEVKVLDLATNTVRTLAKLFGGQGTLNVPSWSPDSKRLAFVSYELLPPNAGR